METMNDLVNALQNASVKGNGVSFAGKSLKLNNEIDAKPVVEAIENCLELHYLNLEGNTLGVDAAKEIARALENHPEFKRALWKDMFTGRMKTEIPKALEFLGQGLVISGSRLTELDLSDNAFGPIGVQGLASLLRSPSCYCLEILRLNNNGLGTEGGKLLSKALLDCYKSSRDFGKALSLKVFIAGRNRLENNGATALAEVFRTIGTLEEIAMPQNGIYHVGIKALSDAFAQNKNLQILNLNDNTIGMNGAQYLSVAMQELPRLREINFGDCLLKTKGAKYLATGLKNNTTLEDLTLGFNEIKVEGALHLVDAMKNKVKLKSLILDGNQFGTNGIETLRSKLKEIGKLQYLGSLEEDESEEEEEEEVSDASVESEGDDNKDNDDDEEDEEDEDETEEEKELIITDVTVPNVKDIVVTLEDFLKSPNVDKFVALGDDRSSVLLENVKKYLPNIDEYITYIMKIAALGNNKQIEDDVVACCELLFKELFTYGQKTDKTSIINNSLLVNLGLIKCEDKKYKLSWNVEACLITLKSLVKRNYFPETTRDSLKLFLQRQDKNPSKAVKELQAALC